MPKFEDLGSTFLKKNIRVEINFFEIGCKQNFVKRLESLYFFAQNTQIWPFGPEVWKTKASRKFQVCPILKFWVVSGRFAIFLGRFSWFCVVSAGYGAFWLFPGLSKYDKNLFIKLFLSILLLKSSESTEFGFGF